MVNIVHFDIGYSGLKLAKSINKIYPKDTIIYEDDADKLRFGLTDIRFNKKTGASNFEDITFSLSAISLILELKKTEPLRADEEGEFISAFEQLMQKKEFDGLNLKTLRDMGGYERVLEDIYAYYPGVTQHTLLTEIDGLEKRHPYLVKPLISDITNFLEKKSKSSLINESERKVAERTRQKLAALIGDPMYSYYSSADIADSKYFYMEFEALKEMGDAIFIPVFLLTFKKLYRRDVLRAQRYKNKNLTPPDVYYIFDEFHNYNRYKSLIKLFEVVLREASRYGIHLQFITQGSEDIDDLLLKNIATRIILPSMKPEDQFGELPRYWSQDDDSGGVSTKRGITFFKRYHQRYTSFIRYGGGVIAIKLPVNDEIKWLFESSSNSSLNDIVEREERKEAGDGFESGGGNTIDAAPDDDLLGDVAVLPTKKKTV